MLRAVSSEDFDFIYTLYMDDSVNPYMSFEKISKQAFQEAFEMLNARDEFLILEEKGEMKGAVTLMLGKWRKAHVASIGSLAVHSNYQKQGVGTRLLETVISRLENKQIRRVELIVESDNPGAIALYEKFGFQVEGTLRNYFKRESDAKPIDDFMMARLI